MAAIKAIEAQSVHKIQSGQVIVDLCSVAKELVENSLDAGSTSVEIRFKNNGLDSIEVQDNGIGIDPSNYNNIALKHYTSKLSSYDDLSDLQTFGFRGEALSSLCALSKFSIITAQADEAPKGRRLEFEISGRLKSTSIVASQKGTTATVENLFEQLPVRRKELAKNIKREYGKVLGLLHAYACISVNVKFTVKNAMPKGKSMTVFSTKANATTRENIANVYGAKTLAALVALDLNLEFGSTLTQLNRNIVPSAGVQVRGHISKPSYGEGRQTPDRQMFFVNGRPCGLPQIAKAINEVYKSYNTSQSPFIFADFCMDTNAYDVNVSPDKRTILLHDSAAMIEQLKTSLTEMFDRQDQTIPHSQLQASTTSTFRSSIAPSRQMTIPEVRHDTDESLRTIRDLHLQEEIDPISNIDAEEDDMRKVFLQEHFQNQASTRKEVNNEASNVPEAPLIQIEKAKWAEKIAKAVFQSNENVQKIHNAEKEDNCQDLQTPVRSESPFAIAPMDIRVRDFNTRMAEEQAKASKVREPVSLATSFALATDKSSSPTARGESPRTVQNAFDRMRPLRPPAELATITIGDETVTKIIGTQLPKKPGLAYDRQEDCISKRTKLRSRDSETRRFSQGLRKFEATGAETTTDDENDETNGSEEFDSSPKEHEIELKSSQESNFSLHSTKDQGNNISDKPPIHDDKRIDDSKDSDPDYTDEEEKRNEERARVVELIRAAEESATIPSKSNLLLVDKAFTGGRTKYMTNDILMMVETSLDDLQHQMNLLKVAKGNLQTTSLGTNDGEDIMPKDEEERLSLTVSKKDFADMSIVGQFNLGFILAVRPGLSKTTTNTQEFNLKDELFIIDQHASDEKFNFERLYAETVVGNQRLVQPAILDLTAVEEEVILENLTAMEKNGFLVEFDTSGEQPVGRRCKLISLPLSKEVIFGSNDLDELIHLLSESPSSGSEAVVPRPSKVRKMFAMRACRSSIMIGKTLNQKQMSRVVKQMGSIEKPWNCPHGRPTMRHLASLNTIQLWQEGDGKMEDGHNSEFQKRIWHEYALS